MGFRLSEEGLFCKGLSGLTLNQYGVASPCPDLKLIHYKKGFQGKGRLKPCLKHWLCKHGFQTTLFIGNLGKND
ncbi:hypothetical protein NEISICOT_00634 [Neisseria sicca ATCC 29256]|uniref:Uncharacterized protein n=1 Tax=Neisseria sicca ATCC 29256 TaxID=547045 RepID=C6M295_NEISI|nr:hypothetical protein NEISICOT_00634 [Neisseria sicca ATCC 29256]